MKFFSSDLSIEKCACGLKDCRGLAISRRGAVISVEPEDVIAVRDFLLSLYPLEDMLLVRGDIPKGVVHPNNESPIPPPADYVAPRCKQSTEKWRCCHCEEGPISLHRKTCPICQHERCRIK